MKEARTKYKRLIQESFRILKLANNEFRIADKLAAQNGTTIKECHDYYVRAEYYYRNGYNLLTRVHDIRAEAINQLLIKIKEVYGEDVRIQWKGKSLIINGKEKFE